MRRSPGRSPVVLVFVVGLGALFALAGGLKADFMATDPGVRGGPPAAGGPLAGLSPSKLAFFLAGQEAFQETDSVQGTIPDTGHGLGPRFNMDGCFGCHSQPGPGGTSPFTNPQVAVASRAGATNTLPPFVKADGPVRDAFVRLKPDGTRDGRLLNLYTITGREDAPGCLISQPDFEAELANDNLSFRIPSPLFGDGLVSGIADRTILDNMDADQPRKQALGISGHPNTFADGIGRFGWKAAPNSIKGFAIGAYNAEVGVTSRLSPVERDPDPACHFNDTPEDTRDPQAPTRAERIPDVAKFAFFIQFLDGPTPVPDTPSIVQGRQLFEQVGCALCHTPELRTGGSTIGPLSHKPVHLYSDLIVHHMGSGLTDQIVVGSAGPDEFRTAPLWGLGQRIFLMHDGRTRDLVQAIQSHQSAGSGPIPPSEANAVIAAFNALTEAQKQSVLDFLRGL